jgi:hypothetical protein
MNNLINLLQISQMDLFIKILFLIINFAFALFLLVVIKQVTTMNTIVNDDNSSSVVKSTAFILFIVSVSLFLTALVIL